MRGASEGGAASPSAEPRRGPQAAGVGCLAASSHRPTHWGGGVDSTGLAPHPTPFAVANAPIHPHWA